MFRRQYPCCSRYLRLTAYVSIIYINTSAISLEGPRQRVICHSMGTSLHVFEQCIMEKSPTRVIQTIDFEKSEVHHRRDDPTVRA